ncbi:hypothetical protein [Fluviicola sp.]|uniref:hypothetical protein n=1 Tax=Fluviicola sp. TaxID=1917219 RepID=UPI0026234C63|nr:hypothetical protein [Fluviicola sp.]
MSQSAYNSLALHDILLSIADSLNEAQNELRSMPPYDEYGRPNTLYQIPYLDFNLEVISQFESTQTGGTTPPVLRGGSLSQISPVGAIRFVPFRSTETTSKNLGTITSNIAGRFVAVMPNDGLPQISLIGTSEVNYYDSTYTYLKLTFKVLQANNEPVAGQRIEVNFDEETSLGFNSGEAVTTPVFSTDKDGYTSSDGTFSVKCRINTVDHYYGKTFVFVANSGTQFSSISISKP